MGLSDIVVYDSVMKSNIPVHEKSHLRQWFEKMTDIVPSREHESRGITKEHVISAVQAFRQGVESNAVSLSLGVVHAEVGLDIGKVPVDALTGFVLTGASVALARHEISRDLLNMGMAAGNCFTFRKGFAWATARKARTGGAAASKMGEVNIAGEENEDPIVQVARTIKDNK